mgnify:CR=1 FL=1
MSKIKEKNSSAKLRSAEKAKDRKFEQWVQQQFMAEAAAIEKEIDEIPDSEEFEPTEEKFQKLLQRAKEQGSVHSGPDSTQTKVSEDRAKEKNGIITSEKIKNEKLNNEKLNEEPKETGYIRSRRKFAGSGEKVVKWAAVAAVTVFGIFGVSMTSEANRAYVMEKLDIMAGNDVKTKVNNDDMLSVATTEEEARQKIIEVLNIEIPRFFYWPTEFIYEDCNIDSTAKTAIIQYSNDENRVYFMIIANTQNASFLATRGSGKMIEELESELVEGSSFELWEVLDEGDERPTYILQWEYKNVYFELSGKIAKSEIEEIAKNIMY